MALAVLTTLDKAKTTWYHFLAAVIAGMGFFTDAYDLFVISILTKLLGRIYYYDPTTGKPGSLPANIQSAVTAVALVGTFTGQLFFGYLGDKVGRKKVYGITLILMIVCSIGSGLSFGDTPKGVIATLCFFRFWLGFGIGGDYPLSATIMAEYSNKKSRGHFIAMVFAMQGCGILAGGVVSMVVASIFNHIHPAPAFSVDHIGSTPWQADYIWRIVLMLGAVPAAATYYFRMKMPETARFTALVEGDVTQATKDMQKVMAMDIIVEPVRASLRTAPTKKYGLFSKEFLMRHGLNLFATCSTWFLLDIAFYSQNLFQKDVFTAVGWLPKAKLMSAGEEVFKIARAQTMIAACSTIPGYWVTVALIEKMGRYSIQLVGFFFMTAFMLALAIPYDSLKEHHHILFIVLYAFTFFFANFGPNSTTFIVPAELFPARLRSTCHGISAASGKLGAIIGAFGFLYASQDTHASKVDKGYTTGIGLRASLFLLAACNFLGFCCSFLVPETKGRSLEDISGENEEELPR